MKPVYKIGQRIKIIPYIDKRHEAHPNNTYHVQDTGVVEDVEKYYEEDLDLSLIHI